MPHTKAFRVTCDLVLVAETTEPFCGEGQVPPGQGTCNQRRISHARHLSPQPYVYVSGVSAEDGENLLYQYARCHDVGTMGIFGVRSWRSMIAHPERARTTLDKDEAESSGSTVLG